MFKIIQKVFLLENFLNVFCCCCFLTINFSYFCFFSYRIYKSWFFWCCLTLSCICFIFLCKCASRHHYFYILLLSPFKLTLLSFHVFQRTNDKYMIWHRYPFWLCDLLECGYNFKLHISCSWIHSNVDVMNSKMYDQNFTRRR